jgi:hypothetical protein
MRFCGLRKIPKAKRHERLRIKFRVNWPAFLLDYYFLIFGGKASRRNKQSAFPNKPRDINITWILSRD